VITHDQKVYPFIDLDKVTDVISKYYNRKIKKSLYFEISKKVTVFGAFWTPELYSRICFLERKPSGISNEFLKENREQKWFHRIHLSFDELNSCYRARKRNNRHLLYFNINKHYKQFCKKNPATCLFFHLMAHELQHCVQFDKVEYKEISFNGVSKSNKFETRKKDIDNFQLPNDKYYYTEFESDAEIGAIKNGPKLVEIYLSQS
jgi:hypothetical protein